MILRRQNIGTTFRILMVTKLVQRSRFNYHKPNSECRAPQNKFLTNDVNRLSDFSFPVQHVRTYTCKMPRIHM